MGHCAAFCAPIHAYALNLTLQLRHSTILPIEQLNAHSCAIKYGLHPQSSSHTTQKTNLYNATPQCLLARVLSGTVLVLGTFPNPRNYRLELPLQSDKETRHEVTPAQVSLAWVLRQDGVIAIPKAVTPEHVRLNAAAAKLVLDEHDLEAIDRVFGAPKRKHPLAMV
jgi:hypothetical protein